MPQIIVTATPTTVTTCTKVFHPACSLFEPELVSGAPRFTYDCMGPVVEERFDGLAALVASDAVLDVAFIPDAIVGVVLIADTVPSDITFSVATDVLIPEVLEVLAASVCSAITSSLPC